MSSVMFWTIGHLPTRGGRTQGESRGPTRGSQNGAKTVLESAISPYMLKYMLKLQLCPPRVRLFETCSESRVTLHNTPTTDTSLLVAISAVSEHFDSSFYSCQRV